MGFPCSGFEIPKISTTMLLNLLKLMMLMALNRLGLIKPSEQISESLDQNNHIHDPHSNNYVLVLDRMSPSIDRVPVHVLTAYIKRKLPVVEFGQVVEKQTEHENQETVCNICLDCIERSHEVREQCNCDHVFHRECLDRWLNQGQVKCPLCRAMLLQTKKRDKTSCKENPWTMDTDAYLDRSEFIVG